MKTTRIVAGIAAAALALGTGGLALSQASAAPPEDRPFGQTNQVELGTGELSADEQATLLMMVDEERMARDLYDEIAKKYPEAVQFDRISDSEQRHYDATLRLLEAYDLDTPSTDPGTYANSEVQKLYDGWLEDAQESQEAAYQVGVDLERADIADLKAAIEESDNADLDQVYGHLLTGFEHHLDAFEAGPDGATGTGMQRGKGSESRGNGQGRMGQGGMNGHGQMNGTGQGGQQRDGSCQNA